MHIRRIITSTCHSLLAGAALSLMAPSAHAADVTWGAPQNITGDSDVSINGTLVGAYNIGDTGVLGGIVNGVSFLGFEVPLGSISATLGNFSLAVSGLGFFLTLPDGDLGSSLAPFSALSTDYRMLLNSGTITGQPVTFDLTMSGLTDGETYEFQWWANTSGPATASTLHSATAGNSVTANDNTTAVEGGLGQFVIGTFTASGSSQTINFGPVPPTGPNSAAQLNAFQLRQVPEPSSLGLLGLALTTLGSAARWRRKN